MVTINMGGINECVAVHTAEKRKQPKLDLSLAYELDLWNLFPMTKNKSINNSLLWRVCRVRGNTLPLLVGMQTCATPLKISMAVSQKIGNHPTTRPSNTTLGHMPKGCSTILDGHLFTYVHSSIVYNG